MSTILAQQGNVHLYLDTAHSVRTLTIQMGRKHEDASITLQPEDLPAVALGLLRSVPTTPHSDNLERAKSLLTQHLEEQEANQAKARLQARREAQLGVLGYFHSWERAKPILRTAVDRIIELEDKLEAQK